MMMTQGEMVGHQHLGAGLAVVGWCSRSEKQSELSDFTGHYPMSSSCWDVPKVDSYRNQKTGKDVLAGLPVVGADHNLGIQWWECGQVRWEV